MTGRLEGAALVGLQSLLGDRLVLAEDVRREFESDFGRFVRKMPQAVARCHNAQEVAALVRICAEYSIPVSSRGQGHTQTGQSVTEGIVLDTAAMNTIYEIDRERMVAVCDGGVVWRDLVLTTLPLGLIPRVLTNNLGVSLAGTTSMAGLGVASFRYGTQADNAVEIEVVTGAGEILVCNAEQNREAWDMFRCGLGQFGLITKVTMQLRACPPKVRMYSLLYHDLATFMKDAEALMWDEDRVAATVGGICSPCAMGFRRIGEGLGLGTGVVGFGRWFYPMFPTIEFEPGQEPDDAAFLGRLSNPELVHVHDVDQEFFCRRMEPMFEAWRMTGYWEQPHPWMETVLPWDTAKDYIETVLGNLPPGALGAGGHVLLWPSRADSSRVPLFRYPEGRQVMGWGILGAVPRSHLDAMLASLDMASEMSIAFGGKRYLSGYITFDTAERWAAHYGDAWPRMCAAKRQFDPAGIFGSGFIQFE